MDTLRQKILMRLPFLLVAGAVVMAAGEEAEKTASLHIADMATELLARSTSSSQVLSLNLSNLGILLLLKTLIFGAFYLSGDKFHKSRSLEGGPELVSEQELLLVLAFLMGDTDQDYSCLQRVACQDPAKSKQYLTAAKFLVKGAKMFESVIPFDNKYEKLVTELQDAVAFGTKYGTCEQQYTCRNKNNVASSS